MDGVLWGDQCFSTPPGHQAPRIAGTTALAQSLIQVWHCLGETSLSRMSCPLRPLCGVGGILHGAPETVSWGSGCWIQSHRPQDSPLAISMSGDTRIFLSGGGDNASSRPGEQWVKRCMEKLGFLGAASGDSGDKMETLAKGPTSLRPCAHGDCGASDVIFLSPWCLPWIVVGSILIALLSEARNKREIQVQKLVQRLRTSQSVLAANHPGCMPPYPQRRSHAPQHSVPRHEGCLAAFPFIVPARVHDRLVSLE